MITDSRCIAGPVLWPYSHKATHMVPEKLPAMLVGVVDNTCLAIMDVLHDQVMKSRAGVQGVMTCAPCVLNGDVSVPLKAWKPCSARLEHFPCSQA